MSPDASEVHLSFLFDEHVHAAAADELRARGIDVVRVNDVGLKGADDATVFEWSRRLGRIVVTRNVQDLAPLVVHAARERWTFPGVLFYSPGSRSVDCRGAIRRTESGGERLRLATRSIADPDVPDHRGRPPARAGGPRGVERRWSAGAR
jgi:hypothetical protein